MTLWWVWAGEPFDTWFGPYDDPEPERVRLQEYYSSTRLQVVQDSKLVRRRVELSEAPPPNQED